MGIRLRFIVLVAVIAAGLTFILLDTREAAATLYCGRPYSQLTLNPGKPYNAVGLLNNGCTAFLIDASHIVAAAHCFEDTATGQWQAGLRFYPNFHPSRVTADPYHVPRADVLRVVVGSRAGESILGPGMDWGIARVGNWQDTNVAGLDLTPLALARATPANGTALSNPAYTRHHFPYDDNDAVTWDNMQWDTTSCGWVKPNNGLWAVKRRPAPFYNGVNRDLQGCNSRWAAGYMHLNCSLTRVENDVVVHNCDSNGGSSGSPVMYKDGLGTWRVIGVGHGGGSSLTVSSNDFGQLAPACSADTPENSDNVAASTERFIDAPRFASNVAVHRSPSNPSATAVFAVDSDLNRVVYRYRIGSSPTYTDKFTYWRTLGAPVLRGGKLSRIAACSANLAGSPQVFVVANQNSIYTRFTNSQGQWSAWSSFGLPGSTTSVLDLDAAQDASGRCLLFTVTNTGAFVRARTSDTTWGSWVAVAAGSYKSITALNNAGTIWAALLDNSGDVWRTSRGRAGWSAPVKLSRPVEVTAWRDIDLTWDELGRGFMLAIPAGLNGVVHDPQYSLWFTPLYGTQPWSQWLYFTNYLWAPGVRPKYPPQMRSITASRWMEDPAGTTTPVIFGTDDRGNVYLVHYSALRTAWDLRWKSFYHEYIPSP